MMKNLAKDKRKSFLVKVGSVCVGGNSPIVVQSMTNTDTADVASTVQQIIALSSSGSELVRITVDRDAAAKAVPKIKEKLMSKNITVPLIGDFHYIGHRLLTEYPDCAKSLDKYRINPGNVGFGKKKDMHFSKMIEAAIKYQRPIRIGVNWGSLDQDLLTTMMDKNAKKRRPLDADEIMRETIVLSALESAKRALKLGLSKDKIILSCKVSRVQDLIKVYKELGKRCRYPLHLGLTEAGMGSKGIVASTAALSVLLQEGIGDTIRISLTPEPGGDRTQEVIVAQEILQSM